MGSTRTSNITWDAQSSDHSTDWRKQSLVCQRAKFTLETVQLLLLVRQRQVEGHSLSVKRLIRFKDESSDTSKAMGHGVGSRQLAFRRRNQITACSLPAGTAEFKDNAPILAI